MPEHVRVMRGGTNLREIIANYLRAKVPAAIDVLRDQYDIDPLLLPYPKIYNSVDPTRSEVYPYMGAYVTNGTNYNPIGVETTGSMTIDPTYDVTMFVSAATANLGTDQAGVPKYDQPYRESALRVRDDLVSVMLNVLINDQALGTAGSPYRAVLEPDSIRVSYPEPIQTNSPTVFVCSGIVVADIKMVENTAQTYYGTANIIDTDVSLAVVQ